MHTGSGGTAESATHIRAYPRLSANGRIMKDKTKRAAFFAIALNECEKLDGLCMDEELERRKLARAIAYAIAEHLGA